MSSRAFARGHGDSGGGPAEGGQERPAASDAELLSFEVVQESRGQH